MKKVVRFLLILICALILILCGLIIYVATYKNPADKELVEAGIVEKQVQVGSVTFNYAEGPDNGPALVLLHAQLLDWYTYSAVLPELSKGFHVYAIDYPGHGKTKGMVTIYRTFHSDEPLEIAFMPVSVQEMLRGLDYYDPTFGAAFYDGTWNEDFNHEEALKKIDCPVLLIQANTGYLTDGTLDGAMSKEMAEVAMDCLSDGKYLYVDSGHVTNLEVPDQFIAIVEDFFLEAENG
jgi:pimeloyl-ACP methyl ester carboxylesterase